MRVAVSCIFGLNGLLAAMWVAHIPVIRERTGVDHATLGGLLLAIGGSALVAMQLVGPLTDRIGSKWPTVVSAMGLSLAILLPGLATSTTTLAVGLVAFGFCNGALDVSMNTQAVVCERAYRRPIMSSFHGYFSVGGLAGAGLVAVGLALDVPLMAVLGTFSAVGVVSAIVLSRDLLTGRAGDEADTPQQDKAGETVPRRPWGRIALLALVAFMLMLAEGVAYDWSALYIVETYNVSDAVGAVAFGAFSATMVIFRFSADTVSARFGPVAVVRGGAVVAVAGMALAICAPSAPWSIVGWAVFGLGIAGGVPQLFTAAGNLTMAASGQIISVVVGFGYVGMLAGPAVIGPLSHWFSLGSALWFAVVGLVVAIVFAPVVRPRESGPRTTGPRHHLSDDRAKLEQ
ncbi:MFS transporter [Williamsia sp.]|uniref:MFS transporter n=1 Tax=Williamsia sp. TaxID=1872085 RepID=UPI0039C8CBEF